MKKKCLLSLLLRGEGEQGLEAFLGMRIFRKSVMLEKE